MGSNNTFDTIIYLTSTLIIPEEHITSTPFKKVRHNKISYSDDIDNTCLKGRKLGYGSEGTMKLQDMHILRHLRRNSRANLTTISRKTGIPVSTIFDKLRGFENGIVQRFTTIVDFAKLGYPIRAKIMLRVDPAHKELVKSFLIAHDRVNNLYRINNGFDYSAECLFESIKEAEEFLELIETKFNITAKSVYHIIDDLAREKALMGVEFN